MVAIPRPDIDFHSDYTASCWIEIDSGFRKKHLLFGCIYRHPGGNIDNFTTDLEELFDKNNLHNHDIYIIGDINIDFFKFTSHPPTEKYLNMLYRVYQKKGNPTLTRCSTKAIRCMRNFFSYSERSIFYLLNDTFLTPNGHKLSIYETKRKCWPKSYIFTSESN